MVTMDMTQMVRQAGQLPEPGKAVKQDPADDRGGVDFLQILRDRQQASDLKKQEEQLAKKSEARDSGPVERDGGKDRADDQLPLEAVKAGAGDTLKDIAFQLRVNPGQLTEALSSALSAAKDAAPETPVQNLAVLADGQEQNDGLVQNAWQVLPGDTDSWPEHGGELEQPVISAAVSPNGRTEALQGGPGKEAMLPAHMTEAVSREPKEAAVEQRAEVLAGPALGESGQEPSLTDIPVKAGLQNRTGGHERTEEELPLNHAADSQTAVSGKDAWITGQEKAQSPVKTTMGELPEAFAKALADRLPERNGTLTIEFEPASLGKVTLRVIYEAGRASVSLMSDNPKTLEILSQNAGQIAGILEDKTGRETVIYTEQPRQQLADSGEGGRQDQREQGEQHGDRRREQRDSFAQQLRLGLV